MLSSKTLLSPEEAAGYAMAAPDDDIENATPAATLDDALRHGHISAARPGAAHSAALAKSVESIQTAVSHWWHGGGSGKAHA
jgi:hypothetical protein